MKISILGIGNYSEVVMELCKETGHEIDSLFHFDSSRNGEKIDGYQIKGDYQDFITNYEEGTKINVVVGIGDNSTRCKWLNLLREKGFNTINLIHPTAYISPSATIGSGVYIHASSFVWTKSYIGNNVIISPKAMVAHHVSVGEGCLISANSVVGSYVTLEKRITVGINAGIISKMINIGSDSIIGANSMVLKSFPKDSVIIGTPGKRL